MSDGHHLLASWKRDGLRRCSATRCGRLVLPRSPVARGWEGELYHLGCYHAEQRRVWADEPDDLAYFLHQYCHLGDKA